MNKLKPIKAIVDIGHYEFYTVGKEGIKEIIFHAIQSENDRNSLRIIFDNGRESLFFNIISVEFENENTGEGINE